jgi:6-phosphogluconolactonase
MQIISMKLRALTASMALCGGVVGCSSASTTDLGSDGASSSQTAPLQRAISSAHHHGADCDDTFEHLYVGCRDDQGTIQHYRITNATGAVLLVDTAFANAAVSNTALSEDERFLYVAHTDTGRISTFSRDPDSGSLTLEGFVEVPGSPDPTSSPATQTLEIDHTGRFLLAANYTANTVLVYALQADGMVGALVASREDGLNAHQTLLTPRNDFALVPYLGSNYIAVYRFDDHDGSLTPNNPFLNTLPTPQSGPRHLALHPSRDWVYSISENAGAIDFFKLNERRGTLRHRQTLSSLPADFAGAERSGSEIEIDKAGEFLYVSNRLDQVANGILGVYSIARDGVLAPIQFEDSRGATPRQFSLSPDGDLLVVGNQGSANMSVFKVNDRTGKLKYVATTPVCEKPFFARMVSP